MKMKKIFLSSILSLYFAVPSTASTFVLQNIEINGVNKSEQELILKNFPVQVGTRLNDDNVAQLIKFLYSTKRYSNVEMYNDNSTLTVNITPKRIIKQINIKNINSVSKNDINTNLQKYGIASGKLLDREALNSFLREMNGYYASIGNQTVVVYNITSDDANTSNINLTTQSGREDTLTINKISFEGNQVFSSSKLKGVMDSKEKSPILFWRGRFDIKDSYSDGNAIKNFYRKKGYANVSISAPELVYTEDQKSNLVNISYHIKEGKQYKVAKVNVLGETLGKTAEIEKAFSAIKIGKLFNGDKVDQVKNKIILIVGDLGYVRPSVNTKLDFNDQDQTVTVNYIVNPNQQFDINTVNFIGNTGTKDDVLRREIPQMEGSLASISQLEIGKTKLLQTGFFQDAEYDLIPSKTDPHSIDVNYKVTETKTGSFNVGIGYGSDAGISYKAGIAESNFVGTGYAFGINGEKSVDTTSINIDFSKPYITQSGISWVNGISYTDYKGYKSDKSNKYRSQTIGLDTGLQIPLTDTLSTYAGFSLSRTAISNIDHEFNRDLYLDSVGSLNKEKFIAKDAEFVANLSYSTLNRGFFPTEGVYASIGGRTTLPGSTNDFYTLSSKLASYIPLNEDQSFVLNLNADAGYIKGFKNKRVPFYRNYSVGGVNSVRGFQYGDIGPKAMYFDPNSGNYQPSLDTLGGNVYAKGTLALIVPTPFVSESNKNSVRTSVFVDIGNAWNSNWKKDRKHPAISHIINATVPIAEVVKSSNKASNYRMSAGLAFEWRSPIGPLVFSYAVPIKKRPFDSQEKFQFSVGGSF